MSVEGYSEWFERAVGALPYPYQRKLGEGAASGHWPELLEVPTGMGKTAAVLVAWLWGRVHAPAHTPRRLVYCLPMRTLVEQTHEVANRIVERLRPWLHSKGHAVPTVHRLMGGDLDESWERHPELPAILVGTQDMLLSRALNRGYAMRRSKWPVHFGLLNSDAFWVFDETQLMGVGVPTSAQLHAFRRLLGVLGPSRSLWMSATLDASSLDTVDMRAWLAASHGRQQREAPRLQRMGLSAQDEALPQVRARLHATKRIEPAASKLASRNAGATKAYLDSLCNEVLARRASGLTLVILNTVERAQSLYEALRKASKGDVTLGLVHSRFRRCDREAQQRLLHATGDRIVVATQALEAGVDVSARVLFTELAPWASLVQRMGRCNRSGEFHDASVFWMDLCDEVAPPYAPEQLVAARDALGRLGSDAAPARLSEVSVPLERPVFHVLRRRDLLALFDTTPDLCGDDVDVSPFVRDAEERDVFVFFRDFEGDRPPSDWPAVEEAELVRVSVPRFQAFLKKLHKRLDKGGGLWPLWVVDPASGPREQPWQPLRTPSALHPGLRVLVHPSAGGYDERMGWTGEPKHQPRMVEPAVRTLASPLDEHHEADVRSAAGRWVPLSEHGRDVRERARSILDALGSLGMASWLASAVERAALWHDVGKAHPAFQAKLCFEPPEGSAPPPDPNVPWAKAPHRRMRLGCHQLRRAAEDARFGEAANRPFFRHELASALGWMARASSGSVPVPAEAPATACFVDLVAYLVAAHHGKVRLSLRSMPGEYVPPAREEGGDVPLFARGVWDGDELQLPSGLEEDAEEGSVVRLDLSPMRVGEGSWTERVLGLLDALGPFRLAFLEALVRIADWRASSAYGEAPPIGGAEDRAPLAAAE